MNGKNILENVDYAEGESQSVTDFLETDCNKCGNKIKFKLAIGDIKNVEEYIEHLQAELELQTLLENERRKQLEQKDRIITYMALYIGDNIDEEHCKKTIGNGKCEKYGQCLKCIKEYFENKVKESE